MHVNGHEMYKRTIEGKNPHHTVTCIDVFSM